MSVQRWAMSTVHGHTDDEGEWVTYADHVAALAEATHLLNDSLGLQRTIHEKALAEAEQRGYEHGHRVALEYFRAVVISDTYRPDTDHHVQTIAIPRLMRLIDLHKESPVPESDYAKGRADALGKAREAVIAECIAHHGYTPGQTCPYCTDALAAIAAPRGES